MEINLNKASPGKPVLPIIAAGSVLAWTLLHLLLANQTELIPEEAYYWTYSQHPALGYFDHPPMVAWMIGLGTALFGNTELGVRIVAILLWPGSALLLFLIGRMWFGSRVAGFAVLLFCLSPIMVGIGFIVTPDAPLAFFWLLALYGISKALHTGVGGFWFLAGIGLGCAMLSKYTAVMLASSLLVFLLLSANYRHWLRRREPWLALALAVAIFSPVIVWNAQHQWASFLFQSTRTVVVRHDPFQEAGMFWAYQLLALTPVLFILYFYALLPAIRRGWIQRQDSWNFAMSFALPLFAVFVMASFKNKGHINWTLPAYLAWSVAAAAIFLEIDREWPARRAGWWRLLVGIGVAWSVATTVTGHTILAWGIPGVFRLANVGGWRELAHEVGKVRDELTQNTGKRAFIVGGDKLNISAEMGFYLRDTIDTVNDYAFGANGIGYRYWVDLRALEGRPAIVVLNKVDNYSVLILKQHFARIEEPLPVQGSSSGQQKRLAYLVKCYGYFTPH